MRIVWVTILLALCGCSSESGKALNELETLRSVHASGRELCNAKRTVAAAYLHENDRENYQTARFAADTQCLNADLYDDKFK